MDYSEAHFVILFKDLKETAIEHFFTLSLYPSYYILFLLFLLFSLLASFVCKYCCIALQFKKLARGPHVVVWRSLVAHYLSAILVM